MAKTMKLLTAVLLAAACVSGGLYRAFRQEALLTLAITCGVTGYHFGARLLVGGLFTWANPRHDPQKFWYRSRPWEEGLYTALNVKAWKNKLPTYAPESFSPRLHSWREIAEAMCRSELVHETNCALSFCPVYAAIWFGDLPVFLITSALAAAFDLLFVIVQRYNRPRIQRLAERQTMKEKEAIPYEPK